MEDIWTVLSQWMVFVLIVISGRVAIGLFRSEVMWPWINAYWVVLTLKNAFDFIHMMKKKEEKNNGK